MSKSLKRYHGDFVRNCIAFWLSLILALVPFALIAVDDSEMARADDSIVTAADPESAKVTQAMPGMSEASAAQASGSLQMTWNEGAKDCRSANLAPLELHAYNETTFIIRESLCATYEAPFIYLLIGTKRALLIDTGDVADPRLMPLADTVLGLLPASGDHKLPLLVVHTHRHLDHRAGDAQLQGLPDVEVVGFDLNSVRNYFGFKDWPNDFVTIDLGDRHVDVLPTPGHNATHIALYDRNTAMFFSGDFSLPGRLLIEDRHADLASAKRVADFIAERPVSYVLGGHIELDANGKVFRWGSQYHPNEHVLPLTKEDLLELPNTIAQFNGIYTRRGQTIMVNQTNMLVITTVAVGTLLAAVGKIGYHMLKRRPRPQ
jgi:hydroxyacylglutathione hydrolase